LNALRQSIPNGPVLFGTFVVGEVVAIDVDDVMYTDGYVDAMKIRPVGRLAGEFYSLTREVTRVPRPKVERRPKPAP